MYRTIHGSVKSLANVRKMGFGEQTNHSTGRHSRLTDQKIFPSSPM